MVISHGRNFYFTLSTQNKVILLKYACTCFKLFVRIQFTVNMWHYNVIAFICIYYFILLISIPVTKATGCLALICWILLLVDYNKTGFFSPILLQNGQNKEMFQKTNYFQVLSQYDAGLFSVCPIASLLTSSSASPPLSPNYPAVFARPTGSR